MTEHVFYLRAHMGELISGFILTLGALLVWTFIHRKDNVFTNRYTKKITAGALMGAVVVIGMISGLMIDSAHSWGNPATAIGLAMQQPWKVFHNYNNLMLIGIVYVAFELLGSMLALGVFVIYVWGYNFATRDDERHIKITDMFKFDETHTISVLVKDALAALIVVVAVLGASNFRGEPSEWAHTSATLAFPLVVGIATMFAISIFGVRGVLTLNPFVWAMAFVLKLIPALYLNRKSITWKVLLREFSAPVAVFGTAAVAGLAVAGILSLDYTKAPANKVGA